MTIRLSNVRITGGLQLNAGSKVGNTNSTTTPSTNGTVTVGTSYGSPFSSSTNSYQIASQPASAPYNYISVPGSTGFAFGTGDFTIEWFQYQSSATTFPRIFWYTATAGSNSPTLGVSEESTFYAWAPSPTGMGSQGTILNTWVHFALVRISSRLYAYRNGTLISTAGGVLFSNNFTDSSSTFYIGTKSGAGLQSEQFIGGLTSFRVCKGVGVYTGNFTKPTDKLGQTQSANPYGGSNTSAITAGQCSLLLNP